MEQASIVSVILAAGQGSRMRSPGRHKVCFEINSEPVICRALQVYEKCGIHKHILVIGHLGEQVRAVIEGKFPEVYFAYQSEPKGTGHAAKCGVQLLRESNYAGNVLVVAGDKVLKLSVLRRLIASMQETDADLVFVTGEKAANPSSGRVVKNSQGRPIAIVEKSEIVLSGLLAELEQMVNAADGPLASRAILERARVIKTLILKVGIAMHKDGQSYSVRAHEVEDMTDEANLSVYLFASEALYKALDQLQTANAQGEEYLTDVVKYLASACDENGRSLYNLATVEVDDSTECMGFNTPKELKKIQDHYAEQDKATVTVKDCAQQTLPVRQWRQMFDGYNEGVGNFLRDTYGEDTNLRERKRRQYCEALEHYEQNYGAADEVFIVRSPGRINLMGRHVDHRGGDINVVAISDECIAVVSPRQDDLVELSNSMPDRFGEKIFSITDTVRDLQLKDWFTCINSPKTLALVNDGDWENYIKAATLRLQERFADRKLRGMRMTVHSNVPIGSGLSSSSAIVVAAAEACVLINDLPVQPHLLVDLCGEGEWFVGTRGGSGDHAAIKLGRCGEIAQMGFFPFQVKGFVPFPKGYHIVIIDSGIMAKKMEGARSEYNSRVLAYLMGEILFKEIFPHLADRIEHLRDINCDNLGVSDAEMYERLLQIPREMCYGEIWQNWASFSKRDRERLDALLATKLPEDEPLQVRDILLYGIAETKRSSLCSEYIASGKLEDFGRMCYISHDGDRVVKHDENLQASPWDYQVSEEYLAGLVKGLQSEDIDVQEASRIQWQPGRYACSVPEIDLIVDMARQMPGVLGAQMAGAGLGGCAMAFVRDDCCNEVVERYNEKGFNASVYSPVQGSGVVSLH